MAFVSEIETVPFEGSLEAISVIDDEISSARSPGDNTRVIRIDLGGRSERMVDAIVSSESDGFESADALVETALWREIGVLPGEDSQSISLPPDVAAGLQYLGKREGDDADEDIAVELLREGIDERL